MLSPDNTARIEYYNATYGSPTEPDFTNQWCNTSNYGMDFFCVSHWEKVQLLTDSFSEALTLNDPLLEILIFDIKV